METEEVSMLSRAIGMCKGLWEGVWKLPGAESQVVGLEQRKLKRSWREKLGEGGVCQVTQALSSTFQGPYSTSLRSHCRILSRRLT